MIAAAVICLVTEASRKRVRASISLRVRRSRTPYSRSRTVRPLLRTSTARPGWPSATSPFRSADVAASRSTAVAEPAKTRSARASTAHGLILGRDAERKRARAADLTWPGTAPAGVGSSSTGQPGGLRDRRPRRWLREELPVEVLGPRQAGRADVE